jgi:hypothetical protein
MVASPIASEAIWIRRFLGKLRFAQLVVIVILTNNQGNIALIKNPIHHNRTKHINIQHYYAREMVVASEIEFEYCNTFEIFVDLFTKPLLVVKHTRCM